MSEKYLNPIRLAFLSFQAFCIQAFCMLIMVARVGVSQAVDPSLPESRFEVASVKISHASQSDFRGGPNSAEPQHYVALGVSLRSLIGRAYGLEDSLEQVSGPSWIDSQGYDVVASIPPKMNELLFRNMLRNLLVDRFRLGVHIGQKKLPVYELVVDKAGLKISESIASLDTTTASLPPTNERDAEGFLILSPGAVGLYSSYGPGGRAHWTARGQPMTAFALALRRPMATGRLVIDKTGLTGNYDFKLQYDLDQSSATASNQSSAGPTLSIFEAVRKQLGLALIEVKEPINVVIIDHTERTPVGN